LGKKTTVTIDNEKFAVVQQAPRPKLCLIDADATAGFNRINADLSNSAHWFKFSSHLGLRLGFPRFGACSGLSPGRQSEKLVRRDFYENQPFIRLFLRLVKLDLIAVVHTNLYRVRFGEIKRFIRLQKVSLAFPAQDFLSGVLL
jgi:hypothetical protein